MKKSRVIALYLPQYHPTLDNDKWWGKGFTEWTNVGKAKSLFHGHYQPKVPTELGYYDLRLPIIREQQAQMAKEAGIDGFCYYHYWFGNGKQELEMPFNEVIESGSPDFPFCLCWANESWHSKFWNPDGTVDKKLLIEQLYLGKDDNEKHFYELLPAFKDHRYMKYKGKLIFFIYRSLNFVQIEEFIDQWQKLAKENGLNGFHFIANVFFDKDIEVTFKQGFDAINMIRINNFDVVTPSRYLNKLRYAYHKFLKIPYIYDYRKIMNKLIGEAEKQNNIYPSIVPNWDHTPRSGASGYLLTNSTPELFGKHIEQALDVISLKPEEDQIIILKSWNEWGEGNYVEPDLKYGRGYIEVMKKYFCVK